jgi:hypothetical protein
MDQITPGHDVWAYCIDPGFYAIPLAIAAYTPEEVEALKGSMKLLVAILQPHEAPIRAGGESPVGPASGLRAGRAYADER